jgi:predicted RNA binding protein YcfA (HicA-like mRNA interferase family)
MEKDGQVVSVPVHSKDLPKGTLTAICKKAKVGKPIMGRGKND